jgi:hypothetical protein
MAQGRQLVRLLFAGTGNDSREICQNQLISRHPGGPLIAALEEASRLLTS